MQRSLRLARAGLVLGAFASLALAPAASADLDEVNTQKLRKNVTVNGILGHERNFQRIANQNGGTRASGTPGYLASRNYVRNALRAAGYNVQIQEFTFPFFRDLAAPTLEQVSPDPQDYETGTMDYSGSGDVEGPLVAATGNTTPPTAPAGGTNAGCTPSDFPAAPAEPAIALVQRGTCFFEEKAANAQARGYDAVIIFNEGQAGRTELLDGTLGRPFDIPVVGLSYEDGAALNDALDAGEDVVMHVVTSTEIDLEAKTWNVIGSTKKGNKAEQVYVGAHLDSVVEGPGINDNGSGSSSILEIAEEMAKLPQDPRRQIKFAFWGAEESGLLGSEYHVENLPNVGNVYANLNFDMVGSPNFVRFVYDGDGSDTPQAGPPGSGQLEALFNQYFASQGLETDPTAFDGRSDYGPFIAVGIPAGGLFTGAEGVKTAEQAAVYGGTAGVAYDPCYHQACDTITNLSTTALSQMSDAAADATWTMARSRSGLFEDGSRRASRQVSQDARNGFKR